MGLIKKIKTKSLFVIYNTFVLLSIFLGWIFVLFLRTKSITLKGYFKRIFQKVKPHKNSFLFHFSSLGEMKAALPLINHFNKLKKEIVITTFTETAYNEAKKNYENVYLLPFDFYPLLSRFIKRISPSFVFITETEFWPSFIKAASLKSNVIWINARVSKKSFKKYLYFSSFFNFIFSDVKKVFLQNDEEYERFLNFFPKDKLLVVGNTKYDLDVENSSDDEIVKLIIKWKGDRFCIVFGSVHPDEFEIIVKSYALLIREDLDVKYLIVPRHIEKLGSFVNILQNYQLNYMVFSEIDKNQIPHSLNILLFDKVGYLIQLYKISDISFVGGSLNNIGGHNLIEPAFFSKPVLFGPNYFSQKMAGDRLIQNGGGFIISDEYELKSRIKFFIFSKDKLLQSGHNAKKTLAELSGATQRIVSNLNL